MKILTGGQFKELDRYTIDNEGIESIDLMERAAQELTTEITARWDASHSIYVFAGPGNNGGDGLAVARILSANGYRVKVWLFNVKGSLAPNCQTNLERLKSIPEIQLTEVDSGFEFPSIRREDIVIDALFGTGLRSSLNGGFSQVVHKINATKAQIVSIDVPSGLMCEDNTYNDHSSIVRATLTLTIQVPKLAFLLADNADFVGEWKSLNIGLSEEGLNETASPYYILEEQDIKDMYRPRPTFAHKGTFGHALLVAGSQGMAGAATLAAKSCLRSGVGKLTVHTAMSNGTILQISVPEAILQLDENHRVVSDCPDAGHYEAIGIGPGLGTEAITEEAVHRYIAITNVPMVIDADAINILAKHPEWQSQIPQGSILTPHVKELERLIGRCSNAYERLTKAMDFAIQRQLFVVLKGHYTAICTTTGRVFFCPAGNPGMATPGSGDVLTGILTGLLAQGYSSIEAAQLGVWLHATAGDLAAEDLGQECMLASDIVSHLSGAFSKINRT